MPTCVNLRETYGRKYRVTYEESYFAEHGDGSRADDHWLLIIPCQHGHIGPYGGTRLFASTNRRGSVAKALRSLDCCEVWQDGDDGLNVTFDVADFDQVAEVMKPRRKRRLSPERRASLVAMGLANLKRIHNANAQDDSDERQCVPSDLDVQSHQPATEAIL